MDKPGLAIATTQRRPSTPDALSGLHLSPGHFFDHELAEVIPLQRRPLTPDASSRLRPSLGPFFDRLPFELRRMILQESSGNRLVGLCVTPEVKAKEKRPATKRQWKHCSTPRRIILLTEGGQFPREEPDPQSPLGAMRWILACQQAYAEGIDVLYSTSKISLDEGRSMGWLSDPRDNTLLIERFCSVSASLSPSIHH
ncbi:hypothetical protein C8A03DRAFT_28826 [Achaetomium macrosporum]|uniref:DUF7730 domain-containing protein n=1 Tax=Achaetomium macrosporum TaxID=79813 RepID=A0AAN7CIQ7_9PEZI|nr:hypothetical protein C8A03DRAFT_28826 [Achaetomium macrosporum]